MDKSRDFDVYNRVKILSILKERGALTFSQLALELKISRPAIYAHIEALEKRGLIYQRKDNKKKGSPVFIDLTNHADPIPLNVLELTWGKWRTLVNKTLSKK